MPHRPGESVKTSPRTVAVFALFVLLALGIRLTYLFQASQPPVGRLVILDSQVYQSRALAILKGQRLPTEVFRMSPAYPCMLAAALAHLAQLYASVG